MEIFGPIDMDKLPGCRDVFRECMHINSCTYDFCVRLDVTKPLTDGRTVHAALCAFNSIRKARMDFDVYGRPGCWN